MKLLFLPTIFTRNASRIFHSYKSLLFQDEEVLRMLRFYLLKPIMAKRVIISYRWTDLLLNLWYNANCFLILTVSIIIPFTCNNFSAIPRHRFIILFKNSLLPFPASNFFILLICTRMCENHYWRYCLTSAFNLFYIHDPEFFNWT